MTVIFSFIFFSEHSRDRIATVFTNYTFDKQARDNAINEIRNEAISAISVSYPEEKLNIELAFQDLSKRIFRELILDSGIRCDGRNRNQLRDIYFLS